VNAPLSSTSTGTDTSTAEGISRSGFQSVKSGFPQVFFACRVVE